MRQSWKSSPRHMPAVDILGLEQFVYSCNFNHLCAERPIRGFPPRSFYESP